MAADEPFEAARQRLRIAIERLEQAADLRSERDRVTLGAGVEIQRRTADRTRLARELDSALARGQRLERANREVSQRLVDSMEHVRDVLERHR